MLKQYAIQKERPCYEKASIEDHKKGFPLYPKNQVQYDGIMVNQLILMNPSFIEKILKKKIKRKLDQYLNLIIQTLDDDSDDDETLRQALNDLSRYRDIVKYKYQKYLDNKYITLLLQKISILEYELNQKMIYVKGSTIEHTGKSR